MWQWRSEGGEAEVERQHSESRELWRLSYGSCITEGEPCRFARVCHFACVLHKGFAQFRVSTLVLFFFFCTVVTNPDNTMRISPSSRWYYRQLWWLLRLACTDLFVPLPLSPPLLATTILGESKLLCEGSVIALEEAERFLALTPARPFSRGFQRRGWVRW